MAELKNLIVEGDSRLIGDTNANKITATSFVKEGGTSSQFLKANGSVDSNTYATTSQLSGKQDTLVSGQNIKTVNGVSILGSGNLDTESVFVAEYGITTFTEVSNAIDAGKAIFCHANQYNCSELVNYGVSFQPYTSDIYIDVYAPMVTYDSGASASIFQMYVGGVNGDRGLILSFYLDGQDSWVVDVQTIESATHSEIDALFAGGGGGGSTSSGSSDDINNGMWIRLIDYDGEDFDEDVSFDSGTCEEGPNYNGNESLSIILDNNYRNVFYTEYENIGNTCISSDLYEYSVQYDDIKGGNNWGGHGTTLEFDDLGWAIS